MLPRKLFAHMIFTSKAVCVGSMFLSVICESLVSVSTAGFIRETYLVAAVG
jgi:hypothetical protein